MYYEFSINFYVVCRRVRCPGGMRGLEQHAARRRHRTGSDITATGHGLEHRNHDRFKYRVR